MAKTPALIAQQRERKPVVKSRLLAPAGLAALVLLMLAAACGGSTRVEPRATDVSIPVTSAAKPLNKAFNKPVTSIDTFEPAATTTTTTAPQTTTTIAQLYEEDQTARYGNLEMTVREVVCSPSWEWDCEEALAVAWCESWHRPWVVSKPNSNGSRDWGLFQINDQAWKPAFPIGWVNVLNIYSNVAMAHHIWLTSGQSWKLWTCQP